MTILLKGIVPIDLHSVLFFSYYGSHLGPAAEGELSLYSFLQ